MTGRVAGRVALVTGASSGLGANFAKVLAREGASVIVAARRKEKLDALVEAIRKAGGKALAVSCDVTDEASLMAAYEAAEDEFGVVDTVIANAGMGAYGPLVSTEDRWAIVAYLRALQLSHLGTADDLPEGQRAAFK